MVAPPLRTPSCQIGCGAQPGQTQMAYTSRENGDTATRHARLTKEIQAVAGQWIAAGGQRKTPTAFFHSRSGG